MYTIKKRIDELYIRREVYQTIVSTIL